jgi:hypothetical protein
MISHDVLGLAEEKKKADDDIIKSKRLRRFSCLMGNLKYNLIK